MIQKSCQEIQELLVDYADGQLQPSDSDQVAAHLAECERCRSTLQALQKSLELAHVIWEDALAETERISIAMPQEQRRLWRYAAIAASILVVLGTCLFWRHLAKPSKAELTFTQIERKITESGNAARLLAAAELLSKYPEAESVVRRQYRYIAERYPDTTAASEAKSKIQKFR